MNTEQKNKITTRLAEHSRELGLSQAQLSRRITDVSATTINFILTNKWKEQDGLISDDMWNRVANYLGEGNGWVTVDTRNLKAIKKMCRDCHTKSIARAIAGEPGRSKTEALKAYAGNNANVFYLECSEFWSKKMFLNKLRQAMGLQQEQATSAEIMEDIIQHLSKLNKPLIIIDEADKVQEALCGFFVTLYNHAKNCGFILSGSVFFEKHFRKGVRLNRRGYSEAFSRIGSEFIMVPPVSNQDVRAICEANGLTDELQTKEVINSCGGDLRRVARLVNDFKMMVR
jgi:DNA transposition AAA+ family ATPase